MSDLHISAVTAAMRVSERKTAMKYCGLYGCATLRELIEVVFNKKRPAGVGFIKRTTLMERLLVLSLKEVAE